MLEELAVRILPLSWIFKSERARIANPRQRLFLRFTSCTLICKCLITKSTKDYIWSPKSLMHKCKNKNDDADKMNRIKHPGLQIQSAGGLNLINQKIAKKQNKWKKASNN
ncbi:MAG: hypothetical protein CVT92_03215 [Bacteroidetes bacterium HGW-Bacteroidetes-1]|jgi:hypothetical protein|nr:MAG: hypothetical protein CVT92_03215 [Bacteroidetes bacterium HGW-Bacteroidetes-1]